MVFVQTIARLLEFGELGFIRPDVCERKVRQFELSAHVVQIVHNLFVASPVAKKDRINVVSLRLWDATKFRRFPRALEKAERLALELCSISLVQGSPPKKSYTPTRK